MASQIISNAKLWVAGYDWSGDANAIALRYGAELKDSTPISGGTRTRLPGLRDYAFQAEGFWNGGAGNVDDAIFNNGIAVANSVASIAPGNAAGIEGEVAFTGQIDLGTYTPGAKIGDVFGFSVAGDAGAGELVKGTVAHNATRAATGNGTVFNLGAVGAGQKVYAAVHVLAPVTGTLPTLVVKVQSAALVGFGSPTDRITFSSMNAIGGQWGTPAAGSITDAFWRVTYTLGGTTPSFPFVVIIGIK